MSFSSVRIRAETGPKPLKRLCKLGRLRFARRLYQIFVQACKYRRMMECTRLKVSETATQARRESYDSLSRVSNHYVLIRMRP